MKINNFELLSKKKKKKIYQYFDQQLPLEITNLEKKIIKKSKKFSMTGYLRMYSLLWSFKHIINKKVTGDFVECGVWKGGNLILLKNLLTNYSKNRKIYGYDTFEGMPKPTKFDVKYDNRSGIKIYKNFEKKKIKWGKASFDEVKSNLLKTCKNLKNINLIKGMVENTLKKIVPKKISLLRLDTDFYESTKICLKILYPKLNKNGVLIIDDYGNWKGCRKAVDEYFGKNKNLFYVEGSCRLMIK